MNVNVNDAWNYTIANVKPEKSDRYLISVLEEIRAYDDNSSNYFLIKALRYVTVADYVVEDDSYYFSTNNDDGTVDIATKNNIYEYDAYNEAVHFYKVEAFMEAPKPVYN